MIPKVVGSIPLIHPKALYLMCKAFFMPFCEWLKLAKIIAPATCIVTGAIYIYCRLILSTSALAYPPCISDSPHHVGSCVCDLSERRYIHR